jgi:hypothetical protein
VVVDFDVVVPHDEIKIWKLEHPPDVEKALRTGAGASSARRSLPAKNIDRLDLGTVTGIKVAADEHAETSLIDFAKQVCEGYRNSSETDFNFVGPEPAEEEAPPTPAAADKTAVEEGDPTSPKNVEDPSAVDERRPIAAAEVQEARPLVPSEAGEKKGGRQSRTAAELADIILNALRVLDGVPERGFVVTVYGANPWNAMLTINPEAGPIKNAHLWRSRVQDIGVRVRQDFDVIHEQ